MISLLQDKTRIQSDPNYACFEGVVRQGPWQKQLFENGTLAFERRTNNANRRRQEDAAARKIAQLEAKLQQKNEVVAELLQEHVQLKKELGEL
jgi:hypothetical protein